MIDHDKNVGELLDLLDELGIAEDTFVMYSTDNGPHMNTWPDGAHDSVPQRKEHQLGRRLPRSDAGALAGRRSRLATVSNEIVQHHDWLPTFLAMAGEPDIMEKLQEGPQGGGQNFQSAIDGYNLLPYLTGQGEEEPAPGLSSTSTTTAIWSRCASTTGRLCSWSSVRRAPGVSGRSLSCRCGFRSYTTCEPIRSNGPTSRRTPTRNWSHRELSHQSIAAQAMVVRTVHCYRSRNFRRRQKAATFTIDRGTGKDERGSSVRGTAESGADARAVKACPERRRELEILRIHSWTGLELS